MSELVNNTIKNLKFLVATLEEDYTKFENGNKAAGTRVRVNAQKMKTALQGIRVEIQESKNKGNSNKSQ